MPHRLSVDEMLCLFDDELDDDDDPATIDAREAIYGYDQRPNVWRQPTGEWS